MGKLGRFVVSQLEPILGFKEEFLRFQTHVLQVHGEERRRRLDQMKQDHQKLHEFVGLTGSLLATSAAATLVHPRLGNVHWSVEALWTSVLIIALITAFSCCMFYSRLAGLRTEVDKLQFYSGIGGANIHDWVERARSRAAHHVGLGDFGVGAIKFWIGIPAALLSLAMGLFMLAFVLFWLLGWLGPLAGPEREERIDSRNTFLVSLAALAVPTVLICASVYIIEQNEEALKMLMLRSELRGNVHVRTETHRSDENTLTVEIEAQHTHLTAVPGSRMGE